MRRCNDTLALPHPQAERRSETANRKFGSIAPNDVCQRGRLGTSSFSDPNFGLAQSGCPRTIGPSRRGWDHVFFERVCRWSGSTQPISLAIRPRGASDVGTRSDTQAASGGALALDLQATRVANRSMHDTDGFRDPDLSRWSRTLKRLPRHGLRIRGVCLSPSVRIIGAVVVALVATGAIFAPR